MLTSNLTLKLAFIAPLLAVILWSPPAEAVRGRTIDCQAGDSIQNRMDKAVASADQGEAVIINLATDCKQDVVITGNDVTFRTSPSVSRVRLKGTITANAAQRFVITNLRISGSSNGVVATNGATGQITDVRVDGNERTGIVVTQGSIVEITDSKIQENGRKEPFFESGLEVSNGATVFSERNLIFGNAFAAVSVSSLGVFRNGRDLADKDPSDKDRDVYRQRGCGQGSSPGCGADATAVFSISTRGLAELRNAFVTGSVLVRGISSLEMDTSAMFGDVQGFDRSGLNINLSVFGDGQLLCSSNAFSYGVASYTCGKKFATTAP